MDLGLESIDGEPIWRRNNFMASKVLIKHILENNMVAVTPQTNLLEAINKMNSAKVGAALILESNGNLAGIFTERDVLTKVVPQRVNVESTPISQFMTSGVITISSSETVEAALQIMNDRQIRHLAVVDDKKKPIGLLGLLPVLNTVMQSIVENFIS